MTQGMIGSNFSYAMANLRAALGDYLVAFTADSQIRLPFNSSEKKNV
jgi:hypothetical protein